MSLDVIPCYEPESGAWSYLAADTSSQVAVIIDPVWVYDPVSGNVSNAFTDEILHQAKQRGYRIEWVLDTHAHADHLSSAGYIRDKTGAKIAIGHGITEVQKTASRIFDLESFATDGSQFDLLLREGDVIPLGSLSIRVMETPGHTPDSISYIIDDAAFIGDTLFEPTHGTARCDFPGGSAAALYDSIQRIYQLPDDTRLFLCHDYPKEGAEARSMVPIVESRNDNIHVNTASSRDAFVAMRTDRDKHLGLPRLIMPALQINIRAGAPPAAGKNGVSYLLTPFNHSIKQILDGSELKET